MLNRWNFLKTGFYEGIKILEAEKAQGIKGTGQEELRGELLNELDYISSRGEHPCRRFHIWATSVIRVIPSLDFEETETLAVCDTASFTV